MIGEKGRHPLAAAAAMALAIAPAGVAAADGPNAPVRAETPAFSLESEVSVTVKAHGQAPVLRTDDSKLEEDLKGAETSGCGRFVRRSFSKAEARADRLALEADRVQVRLQARSYAQGGHYRRCVSVTGYATSSSSSSEAKATMTLRLPQNLLEKPVLLTLQSSNSSGLNLDVVGGDGKDVPSVEGQRGRYLIRARSGEIFFIRARLAAQSETTGSCCDVEDRKSALVTASIEPGPILYSQQTTPYIRGGTVTAAYKQVGAIRLGGLPHCTGTVVGPKTILTAAHCVAGYEQQIAAGKFTFTTGASAFNPDRTFKIVLGDYPRDQNSGYFYNAQSYEDDIAVVYLDAATDISPIPVHTGNPDWDALKPLPILFVGYGFNVIDGDLVGAGIKREAQWKVDRVDNRTIAWANSSTSTCQGDSGGPALFTHTSSFLLVAVTSVGDEGCTYGRNTRLDSYQPWLNGRIK